ncbi:MAG: hypothetical protein WC621_04135 [Patescibacteria group bacterium]
MKLSKVLHVISVIAGLVGVAMSAFAVLIWPADVVWFGLTRDIATMHHMMLENRGEII